jgi:hypothetical protein
MILPDKYACYFEKIPADGIKTLSDAQTKLYIKVHNAMYIVTVDKGIVQNIRSGIKKCDFLVYDKTSSETHLIELKGKNIDKSYEQLRESIDNIYSLGDINFLIDNLFVLDAYIVSPERQNIPRGINSKERNLANKLAKKCSKKMTDITTLIHYVVVSNCKKLIVNGKRINCSHCAPLEFPLP